MSCAWSACWRLRCWDTTEAAGVALRLASANADFAEFAALWADTAAFDEITTISLQVSIYVVAQAALMVAGSFIGAEYSTGSIANWLSFIPR